MMEQIIGILAVVRVPTQITITRLVYGVLSMSDLLHLPTEQNIQRVYLFQNSRNGTMALILIMGFTV